MKRALKTCDTCAERIQSQITHFENVVNEKIQPKMSPELAVEIRRHFQQLDDLAKTCVAVQQDVRASSAILSGPAFLSGLNET